MSEGRTLAPEAEAMKTELDSTNISEFVAILNERMSRCDNGEGMECANMDFLLNRYSEIGGSYLCMVRKWSVCVFSGSEEYDSRSDQALRTLGSNIYSKIYQVFVSAQQMEFPCYEFANLNKIRSVLFELQRLLDPWMPPSRAVSPAARRTAELTTEEVIEAQKKLAELKPIKINVTWGQSGPSCQIQRP